MSEKSEPSEAPSAGSSSMKVNIMYRGIVYRVRGIKVLCSVVTAVILLLVAIVGLGVWMLVSAFAEEKVELFDSDVNATEPMLMQVQDSRDTDKPPSTPYTIDFNAPSVVLEEISPVAKVPITDTNEEFHINEAVSNFQGVTPGKDLTTPSRIPGPDPTFGLFGGLLEFGNGGSEGTTPVADIAKPDSWQPMGITHDSDSQIQHSENRPMVVPPPSDGYSEYSDGMSEYVHNDNRKVDDFSENSPGYPLQGGLPDNIPRDIDPALLDMGLPFPYPPSLPTTKTPPTISTPLPRRPIIPNHHEGPQHTPPEIQGQLSRRPPNSRQPYQQHPAYDPRQPYDYSDQPAHDYNEKSVHDRSQSFDYDDPPETYDYDEIAQVHGQPYNQENQGEPQQTYEHYFTPSLQGSRQPYQPSTLREAPTENSEILDLSPDTSGYDSSQYTANRGDQTSHGFTIPAGVKMPPGIKIPSDIAMPPGVTMPPGITIPTGISLPEGVTLPENLESLRNSAGERLERVRPGPAGYFDDMMYYYNKHERKVTPTSVPPSVFSESQYSQRKGLTQEDSGYSGPPVVGYGDRVRTTDRRPTDPAFQHFWDVYNHNGKPPAEHDDRGPVPEEVSTQSWNSPSQRRPRPHFSASRPNSDGPRPSNGSPRPINGGPRPNSDGPRPSNGGPRPSNGGARPINGGPRPSNGGPRPINGGPRLSNGGPRPNSDGPRPSNGGPRPINGGPRPNNGGPQHNNGDPQPNNGGPQLNNGGPWPNNVGPRPEIRGLQPNRQSNPLPSRPDAERPPVQIPNRSLWVEPSHRPPTETAPRPPRPDHPAPQNHRPLLGPLYDIYEYSQRLASTLLSFPSKIDGRFNESREEYMQNEVELLEDYNKVFKEADTTSADVLPDMFDDRPGRNERLMLIDSEKLRALNPFELSLITWTFLDFWEFLIEKVGTLSKEDLQLLELRLERLRQSKDRVLTQNFMSATVNQVSHESDRSLSEITQAIAMTEDLETLPDVEKFGDTDSTNISSHEVVEGRMWDPLGMFSSEQRVKFMEFAIKVLFKFGRVYLKKRYALDCMMLLFCKDLNANAKKTGMDGMAAKLKSVGLKVLVERENRQMDTIGEIWRSLTNWETLQCDVMFPKCDGPKALEIVNDVALGARK